MDKEKPPLDVDDLLCRILSVGLPRRGLAQTVKSQELVTLCSTAKAVFSEQHSMLEIDAPVKICGDTHGQFPDLLRLFDRCGFPPLVNYLFLGDYVDRGSQGLECIALMFCYKNFFLLRGNHECRSINYAYGFHKECIDRYPNTKEALWEAFQSAFSMMPLTALVGDRILCMHGGISQELNSLEQLRNIKRPFDDPPNRRSPWTFCGPIPTNQSRGGQNGTFKFTQNSRGVSFIFGVDDVVKFTDKLKIDLVVRAHQVVQDGYEFFAGKRLVTIFSAPHYCGQFDNAAAVMNVDENLVCSFVIMRPIAKLNKLTGRP